jgi:hypothetical protein
MAMRALIQTTLVVLLSGTCVHAEPDEKLSDDPTKIVTKLGVRYTDYATGFGSVAFGPVTKINVSVSENEDWSVGGSYLFPFGIVNVAASQKNFSGGVRQTQYSIGSFVPLSAFGIQPAGWQMFTAFGYNYSEGSFPTYELDDLDLGFASTASRGGYFGVVALKPLSPKWTFKSGIIGSKGSNDYSGFNAGGGFSYTLTDRDTLSINASYTDNSFGARDQIGVSYSREF